MQVKHWVLAIRITNLLSSATLVALQIWFMIELLLSFPLNQILVRIFAPIFLVYFSFRSRMLGFLMLSSEFRYKKVVEYFKFLQETSGLILFNLLYHSSHLGSPLCSRWSLVRSTIRTEMLM
jgi:hypothetical protein